jgi:redox-sensitive bicupin YhaK (pirin superfamily)
MHRDSLGTEQRIEPGAINWMTAGRGIVHSERKPADLRDKPYVAHGLQLWAALPLGSEEVEPSFVHTPADAIPQVDLAGAQVRVLVGEAFGVRSPVMAYFKTVYLDVRLEAGASLVLPSLAPEAALYVVDRDIEVDGGAVSAQRMAVLHADAPAQVAAPRGARFVLIGGEPLDAPRHMWWNFVSSRKERILHASQEWDAQRMGQVPGEHDFIPLPPTPFTAPEPRS